MGDECGRGKLLKRLLGAFPLLAPICGDPMENELSKPDAAEPGRGVGYPELDTDAPAPMSVVDLLLPPPL